MTGIKNLSVNPWLKQGDSADRLPTGARFVCEYDLYLGVDTLDEEAFIRSGNDQAAQVNLRPCAVKRHCRPQAVSISRPANI